MEVTVSSWEELNGELFPHTPHQKLGRFRSHYVYRGMSNAERPLTTSLLRLNRCPTVEANLPLIEKELLFSFQMYGQQQTDPGASIWYWLSVAQHHGLPTRLMDWTWSPFVAMHFATADLANGRQESDAVIWCINIAECHRYLPRRPLDILNKAVTKGFYAEMMSELAENLEEFDDLSDKEFVVFFEPPALDERIINQYALFSLMNSPQARLDEWLMARSEDRQPDQEPLYRRIIIPARLKWEVRDKLDGANINERVLFPGLDGLSAWLKRHYSCGPLSS